MKDFRIIVKTFFENALTFHLTRAGVFKKRREKLFQRNV